MILLRRFLLLLVLPLLAALSACQRPEDPPRPATLLSKDQMVRLLIDLHLLEARIDASRLGVDTARALYVRHQRTFLRRAQTTDSAFQQSYRYYGVHGKDLDDIYQAVIDSLGSKERQMGGVPSKEPEHNRYRP